MYDISEHTSVMLSEVMEDIGVTEKMVEKRRRSFKILEVIETCTQSLLGRKVRIYNLGSQSEGSTTIQLDSDIDKLHAYHDMSLILDWEKAEDNEKHMLIVQDDNNAPGHCFLQVQSSNITFHHSDIVFRDKKNYLRDEKGRLFLKNSCFNYMDSSFNERNGPAHSFHGNPGLTDEDNVCGWHCKYWPNEAQQWLVKDCKSHWPTEDMKRECEEIGCTIVPISSKGSQYGELEWRISTCLAERRLMFSLNITQMRCYVLMKMIRKTFIEPKYPDTISSYICKTVLFHCLHNESSLNWQVNQLIRCLESCLDLLEVFVKAKNCPHFIIPGNNLLQGKFSEEMKDNLLIDLLHLKTYLIGYLCKINLDHLGLRLMKKTDLSKIFGESRLTPECMYIQSFISMTLLSHIAAQLSTRHKEFLKFVMSCKYDIYMNIFNFRYHIIMLSDLHNNTDIELEKSALQLLIPFFRSSLASTIASHYIDIKKSILEFPDVINSFKEGTNSDVSAGKLKFASALYCSGELDKTKDILQTLQQTYDKTIVETVCKCYNFKENIRKGFQDRAHTGGEELIREIISFCVPFLHCEVKCVPRELQYEMFRSTAEDKLHRHFNDNWMDWAVVDSLPYLYFLQYKIYSHLQETGKQRKALSDLAETIRTEPNLGHRETALNLLGQCMEQENCCNKALNFYIHSLQLRPRNNAAKIHICIMISKLINRKYCTATTVKKKQK